MGSVSSFWCHICASKFMLACIYQVILRVRMGLRDYLKYSPVAAKILLLCWENVKKDLRRNPPHVGVTSGQKPSAKIIKPRSHRLGGFLLCLQFIKPRSRRLGGFLLCLRFIIKPRSRRLGGFLLCLRFIFFLSVTISKPPRMMSSSANYRPFLSSFRHIPPQESFVKLAN